MFPILSGIILNEFGPFLIPIVAMVIPIVAIISNYAHKRDHLRAWHQQRMAAIEKGIELPPFPTEMTADPNAGCEARPESFLLAALILIGIGTGAAILMHALRYFTGFDFAVVGAVPGFIGVALLFYYLAIRGRKAAARTNGGDGRKSQVDPGEGL